MMPNSTKSPVNIPESFCIAMAFLSLYFWLGGEEVCARILYREGNTYMVDMIGRLQN